MNRSTPSAVPSMAAIRVAGGRPAAARSASSRAAAPVMSQVTRSDTTGTAASASMTTCPPAASGRTRCTARAHVASASSCARRSWRFMVAHVSRISAAP